MRFGVCTCGCQTFDCKCTMCGNEVVVKKKTKFMIISVISIILLTVLDRITKMWAITALSDKDISVWSGVFRFSLVKNTGAVFGMFEGATIILAIITVIVLLGVVWFYIKLPDDRRYAPLRVTAIFIVSGALGNLIDRIMYGFVVDFLYFELIDFYVFNIADCYITVSIIIILLLMIFKYREKDFEFLPGNRKPEKPVQNSENGNDSEDGDAS